MVKYKKKTDPNYSQFVAEQESDSANSSESLDSDVIEEHVEARKRGPYKKKPPEVIEARKKERREKSRIRV